MLLNIVRFFKGYVTFLARGKFSERLLNILNTHNIRYWDVVPEVSGGLLLNMYIYDYIKLRHLICNTGIKTRVKGRHGLPFLIKKYKCRIGIPIGLALFVFILWLSSSFTWIITVTENETLPVSQILQVANDKGLYQGVYTNSINVKSTERKILQEIPDIRWISINLSGCKAEISIKEKYKSPKVIKKDVPCNVKSSRDAVVIKTGITKGTSMVKSGSAVIKGQLLVSGVVTNETGESTFVHADGEILGRTNYEKNYKLPKTTDFLFETENNMVRNRFNFLWFSIPTDFKNINYNTYKSITKKDVLKINGVNLPASFTRQYVTQMENKTCQLKNYKSALKKLASINEAFFFNNKEIEKREYKYSETKNYYCLNVKYTVVEDLAVSSKIYIR